MGYVLAILMTVSAASPPPAMEIDQEMVKEMKRIIMLEINRQKRNADLPGCPYDSGDRWRRGLACA